MAEAILHYEGSATGQDPTSSPRPCSVLSPCVVVNCPFKLYPPEDHIHCITVDQLRGAEPMPVNAMTVTMTVTMAMTM